MVSTLERSHVESSTLPTRRWVSSAAIAGLVISVLRWTVTHDRREYSIWPDEPAQLAIARYLGGGTRWNLDDHSVWRPLYGALLAPIHWFTDDPETVLRSALVVNAVLGGVAAALLVVLARRLTAVGPVTAGAIAVVVSSTPAVLFTTEFVWSESLLLVLFPAALLAVLRFHRALTVGAGVAAAAVAGLAFAAHSRMLPVALVVVALAVLAVVQGRCDRRVVVATTTATAVSVVAVIAATDWIVGRLWDQPSDRNSAGGVLGQFGDPPAIVVSALGQLWSLLVASLGFAAFGAWAIVGAARRRQAVPGLAPKDASVVLVVVGSCVALSVVFMADRWRTDQLVYGRYNTVVTLPVLVVGVAAWLDRPRPPLRVVAATVAVILASGSGLWLLRRDEFAASNGLEPMILGLQPFVTGDSLPIVRMTLLAAAAAALLGAIARRRTERWWPVVGVAVLVGLVSVASIRTARIIDAQWADSGGGSWYTELADRLDGESSDGERTVDWYLPAGSTSTKQLMLAQFHVPRVEFEVVHDSVNGSGAEFVFAATDDESLLASSARLVHAAPGGRTGLWER